MRQTIGLALSSAAVLDLESGVVRIRLDHLDERLRWINQIVSVLQIPDTDGEPTHHLLRAMDGDAT